MDDFLKQLDYLQNKKNKEFDQFEPFQGLEMATFEFRPKRFEVWQKGAMTHSGAYNGSILSQVRAGQTDEETVFTITDSSVHQHIFQTFYFDVFYTQSDRLQHAKIPPELSSDSNGLSSLRWLVGDTCGPKVFHSNEPYCSGLFLQNGAITKITFSFNEPVRLIEFYS
jgi:hypothetical protein